MSTKNHRSTAERLGHWLGGAWRAYARRERRAATWLAARGVPAGGAAVLLWVVKLGVLGILFYATFWLTLLVVFAIVAAWAARNTDWEEQQSEWRDGFFGFGLYHPDGSRIDPHDPDDEL